MSRQQILIQVPAQSVALAEAGCGYRPVADFPNPISLTSDSLGAAGNIAVAKVEGIEKQTGKRLMIGDNLKIYKNFNGNQYVATVRITQVLVKVGVGTFVVSTIVDGYELLQAHLDPQLSRDGKVVKSIKFGVTLAVGVVAFTLGAIPAMVVGVVYFGLDKTGLLDHTIAAIYNEVVCNIAPAVSQKVEDVKRAGNNFWWQFERELIMWLTQGRGLYPSFGY
jgi:hypothetical protein